MGGISSMLLRVGSQAVAAQGLLHLIFMEISIDKLRFKMLYL